MFGGFLQSYIAHRCGIKQSFLVSLLWLSAFLFFSGYPFFPVRHLGHFVLLVGVGFFDFGGFNVTTLFIHEIFPTSERGLGTGFCLNLCRLPVAIVPFLVDYLILYISPLSLLEWSAIIPFIFFFIVMFGNFPNSQIKNNNDVLKSIERTPLIQ